MAEVLRFTPETCGACQTQREQNEVIGDACPAVEFRELDTQSDLEIAEEYGVQKPPTTLVYANGDRTDEFTGTVDRDDWRRLPTVQTRNRPDARPGSPASYADDGPQQSENELQ